MTFDLEKARDAAKFDDRMAITMFPLAIAEIERLRAEISEQKGMIWKTQQVKKEQAARIAELEADLEQSESKIGPDARPPCWQITEDRVTAIDQGLRFLEWSNAKTGHVETKKRIAILKTMLEEASGQRPTTKVVGMI